MMEITKKELQELRIKDVFVTEGETLSCRMIYDLIEGHINKRHIILTNVTLWNGAPSNCVRCFS